MDGEIKNIVTKHGSNPGNLIPILQDIQAENGYLSEDAISELAIILDTSESTIYGVATFFTQFKFSKPGEHQIKVCLGTACHVKGSETLLEIIKSKVGIEPGETTSDGKFSLERVACMGCCALAPVIVVDDEVHGKMTQDDVGKTLEQTPPTKKKEETDDA